MQNTTLIDVVLYPIEIYLIERIADTSFAENKL